MSVSEIKYNIKIFQRLQKDQGFDSKYHDALLTSLHRCWKMPMDVSVDTSALERILQIIFIVETVY